MSLNVVKYDSIRDDPSGFVSRGYIMSLNEVKYDRRSLTLKGLYLVVTLCD